LNPGTYVIGAANNSTDDMSGSPPVFLRIL
jgi:hypothetical protein